MSLTEAVESVSQTIKAPSIPLRRGRVVNRLLAGVLSLLVVVAVGLRNGELNQVFYLLHGLHRAEPTLLTRDWYTIDSLSYHQWWDALIFSLVRLHLLEAGLTVGTVLLTLLFVSAVYLLVQALYEQPLLSAAAGLLVFCGLFTRGLGDWDLLAASVEPFSISGVLLICGLTGLARRQPAVAGVALGLSALLHSHFAVLVTGVLILSLWPILHGEGGRFALRLSVPFGLLAAPTLWQVLHFASASGGAEALRILSAVGPQHYFPWRVALRPFIVFGAALLFGVIGFVLRPPRKQPALWAVVLSIVVLVCGSLLICAAGLSSSVERALPWRLSSILILLGILAGCAGLTGSVLSPLRSLGQFAVRGRFLYATGLLTLAILGVASTSRGRWAVVVVEVGLLSLPILAKRLDSQVIGCGVIAFLLAAGFSPIAHAELPKSHWRIRTMDPDTEGVFTWARQHSALESLWLVPPTWKDFRLNARRSILVDWSATPFFPADVIEWNRRMLAITALPQVKTVAEVTAAYDAIDCARLQSLEQAYRPNYLVTPSSRRLSCAAPVFTDLRFTIWQLASK